MRKKEAQGILLVALVVIGAIISVFRAIVESVGLLSLTLGLVAIIALIIWLSDRARKQRRATLLNKYGDLEVVEAIMNREIWVGQTYEQLRDSRGEPVDMDERVLKTKVKHTWKYHRRGRNRYALRVTLDNGVVVGWQTSH